MSYACHYDVPTDEQTYQRVTAAIGDEPSKGLVVHLVVKNDTGGLRHVTVWESQEDWERFRAERVQPAIEKVMAAAGITEIPPRPVERAMEVVDVRVG